MYRSCLAAIAALLVATSLQGAFSIVSPAANTEFNHNANISAFGTCSGNEVGIYWVEYDADDPGGNSPVTWQSANLTGVTGNWSSSLMVPAMPGYWHDFGFTATVQLKVDPPNGAAGERDIKIKDKP